MGLSGYEVIVMTSISPYFLGFGPLRRFLTNRLLVTYTLALTGLVAFTIPDPANRLLVTGGGVVFSCLALAAGFFAERSNPARLDARISGFSLGLIVSSVAKFACYSNNPIWPIMNSENGGWNKKGLVLAVLAVIRSTRKPTHAQDLSTAKNKNGSSFLISLGLAGLVFGLHTLLSDSSTMITWVWDGYPVTGPLPAPHGAYTLLAMGAGFMVGCFRDSWSRSWTVYGIGCTGVALLYRNHGWWGFYGALIIAAYLMAIIPSFIRTAVKFGPGKTFGNAFLMYNLLVLAHVWTVAYAFVPGGPLLRERTDLVMTVMMLLIGAGVFSTTTYPTSSKGRIANIAMSPFQRRLKSYFVNCLVAIELFAVAVAYMRFPTFDYQPFNKKSNVVSVGIWTVHFGIDNDMWSSERRMRDLIKEMEVDIIGNYS